MKLETIKDVLIATGAAGALFISASSFISNVNKVPKQERAIKRLNKRMTAVESKQDFLVSDAERRTGRKYVQPVIRDDEDDQ